MWEREGVIRSVTRLLDAAKAGRGGALFITADAGLGKTAVLEEACRLGGADFQVGSGRGDPMETLVPFGLVGQVVEGLGGRRLLEPTAAGELGADRRAAQFYAVLRWLDVQTGPLLCTLDDLHWADADTLNMLTFLCRRLATRPVAVICTLRPWPPAALEAAGLLAQTGGAVLERLLPLSEPASRAMLSARAGHPVSEVVSERAWSLCGGNPLLLEQLALVIRRGETVPEAIRGSSGLPNEMVLAHFAGLPSAGMRYVQAASVLGVRFPVEVAAELAQLPGDAVDGVLEAVWRSGLVRESAGPGLIEFVHPLFHQALYEDLGAPLRSRLHARAFAALVHRGAEAEAAPHAIRGGMAGDPEAIGVLERGGRSALRTGALAAAAEHFSAAVDLAGERAEPELLLLLAEALLVGGRAVNAVAACERVLTHPRTSPPERVHALRMLGRALFATGAHDRSVTRFEEAAALAEAQDAGAAAQILLEHALTSWLSGGPAGALPLAVRARQLAQGLDGVIRRRAEATWGFVTLQAGDGAGLEVMAAAAEPVARDPMSHLEDVCWTWGPLALHGIAAAGAERSAEASRSFEIALQAAERVGAAEAVASLRVSYAYALARVGRLREAVGLFDAASELVDLVPVVQAYAGAGNAHVRQLMGRLDESRRWCETTEPMARARGDWVALLLLWDVQGHRRVREGQFAEASAIFTQVEAATERLGIGEPCLIPWARHAITAHVGSGRPADARRVVEWLEHCAARLPCRWPRIVALTGRAALEELAGDREAAESLFQQALQLHQGLDLAIQQLETMVLYGAFLRRTGQPMRARPLLAEAVQLAESIEALWLRDLAHAELAVAGGRRRRRGEPEQLTPQEQRVAELARTGMSNKEIAQQLWVSVSTVETHLQQVYAKLGVRSRRQLMRNGDRSQPGTP